jgi:endonuclease/exonuclease/phosphatase family metal-dependent hydrolase
MPFYTRLARANADPKLEETRQRTIAQLKHLKTVLSDHLAQGRTVQTRASTVRIATWNLREFGGSKSGGRETEPLYYIAEIISHFDVVALQEVRGNLAALHMLLDILGPDWDHLATDVTDGDSGNGERMVFLFDTKKAHFTHIAGELTLPDGMKVTAAFGERIMLDNGLRLTLPSGANLGTDFDARLKSKSGGKHALDRDLEIALPPGCSVALPDGCSLAVVKNTEVTKIGTGRAKVAIPPSPIGGKAFRLRFPGGSIDDSFKQFARTPYLVSMQSGWLKINLCTVHIYFGDSEDPQLMEQRRGEIQALTNLLGERAKDDLKNDPKSPVLTAVLGDFNIMNHDHPTMKALENSGFEVPDALKAIPGSNVEKDKAYDQIAFWEPKRDRGFVKVEVVGAGVFDYYDHIYRLDQAATYLPASEVGKFKDWRTYKMSDHLPMWIELRNDFSEDYLDSSAAAQLPVPPPP